MYRHLLRGSRVLQRNRSVNVSGRRYAQTGMPETSKMVTAGVLAVGGVAVLAQMKPDKLPEKKSSQPTTAEGLDVKDMKLQIERDLAAQEAAKLVQPEPQVEEAPVEAPVEEVVAEPVVEEVVVEPVVEEVVEEPVPEEVAEVVAEVVEEVTAQVEAEEVPAPVEEVVVAEPDQEAVEEVVEVVEEVAEVVAEAAEEIKESVEAVVEAVEAVAEAVEEVVEEVQQAAEAVEEVAEVVVEAVEAVAEVAEAVVEVAETVAEVVEEKVEELVEAVKAEPEVEAAVAAVIEEVQEVIPAPVEEVAAEVAETVESVVDAAESAVAEVAEVVTVVEENVEAAVEVVEAAADAVVEEVAEVTTAVVETVETVEAAVEEVVEATEVVVDTVEAAVEAVVEEVVEVAQEVEEVVAAAVDAVEAEVAEVSSLINEIQIVKSDIEDVEAQLAQVGTPEQVTVPEQPAGGSGESAGGEAVVLAEVEGVQIEAVNPEIKEEAKVEDFPEEVQVEVVNLEEVAPEQGDEVYLAMDDVVPVEAEVVVETYPEIPPEMPYVIVGGGTAAYAAVRAIRKYEPGAKILILSKEMHAPYNRTPLSKEMWFAAPDKSSQAKYENWKGKEVSIYHEKEDFYCTTQEIQSRKDYGGTALLLNATVERLNPEEKKVVLSNGAEIAYEKCLIAVGGQPRSLPVFDNAPESVQSKITKFRSVEDFWKLEQMSRDKPGEVVVIGSGFLGTELAYALGERSKSIDGLQVTQVCRESGVLGAVLPLHLSNYASAELEKNNVKVVREAEIGSVSEDQGRLELNLTDGRSVQADHAVLAVGVDVDNGLAVRSGLEHDSQRGGFIVNSELESRRDVFVAGDAANFYDIRLGRRRVEHYDHAIVTGRLAGENMTGKRKAYSHQSMFWSDIGPDIAFEAIGLVDSRLKSVSVFTDQSGGDVLTGEQPDHSKKYDRGVVFYTRNDTVVGVVTWNIFNKMGIARRLIAMEEKNPDYAELAKLFDVNKL